MRTLLSAFRKTHQPAAGRLAAIGLAALTALVGVVHAPQSASAAPNGYVSAKVRVTEAIKAYTAVHPDDYIGLNQAIVRAGGDPVRFDIGGAGLYNLTPEQAQNVHDATTKKERAGTLAIPSDAFSVSGYWSHVQDQYGEWWTYYGSWNFRNTYDDGGHPRDAMAVQTRDIRSSCWRHDGDDAWAFTEYNGNANGSISRRMADFDSAVWNVDDSRGPGVVDRGTLYISYKRITSGSGCSTSKYIYGKTYFEHNWRGCNCSWSVSITAGVMNITHSQSDPPEAYQESTTLIGTWD